MIAVDAVVQDAALIEGLSPYGKEVSEHKLMGLRALDVQDPIGLMGVDNAHEFPACPDVLRDGYLLPQYFNGNIRMYMHRKAAVVVEIHVQDIWLRASRYKDDYQKQCRRHCQIKIFFVHD